MTQLRALIIHPHSGTDPAEWTGVAEAIAELEQVARVETFDTGRALRAERIAAKALRAPRTRADLPPPPDVPYRRDTDE